MVALCRYAALAFALVSAGAILTGCKTWDGGPDRLYTVEQELTNARDLLPTISQSYAAATNEADRFRYRNDYIGYRMYIIDVEYSEYEAALTSERQKFGFLTSVGAQGLNTAGALVSPASTVRILSGIAGGVSATRGYYDSEIVVAKTIQIAQGHMRAERDRVAVRILTGQTKAVIDYPLSAALHDLEDYYRAGTLTAGLIEAVGEAGAAAQTAAEIKARAQGIDDPNAPLPQALQRRPSPAEKLRADDIRAFQSSLCVIADGKPGDQFFKAVGRYLSGLEGTAAVTPTAIGKRTEAKLNDAANAVPNCKTAGYKDAYEVGAFGVGIGSVSASDRIKELQGLLKIEKTGKLDAATRTAVAKYRTDKNINPGLGDQIDKQLMDKLIP